MGLFKRAWQVIRTNINGFIEETEDPEKMMEEAIENLEQQLILMRQGVARAIATVKRTEREEREHQKQGEIWYSRAQLALKAQEVNVARDALEKLQEHQNYQKIIQTQLNQQNTIVNSLKLQLRDLEKKTSEAKMKKNMYLARATSAVAAKNFHEIVGDMEIGSKSNGFDKMEEKVLQLEAELELITHKNVDSLEAKFAALENSSNNNLDVSSISSISTDEINDTKISELDLEIEKLRSKLDSI